MKKGAFPRSFGGILAVCGILLMLYGIFRGEMAVVLQKATHICLECIGIG